jgi:CubicO group peptidase (beta-lactamase class C family)
VDDADAHLKKPDRPVQQRLVGFPKNQVGTLGSPATAARSIGVGVAAARAFPPNPFFLEQRPTMQDMTVTPTSYDFSAVHATLQRYVDGNLLSGVSSAVLIGRDLVDLHCTGLADKEQAIALRNDQLYRVFSNTKLVTSCAALLLFEEGRFHLDDAIEQWIPQLAQRQVLRPGATALSDTEPARSPITVRQLLSHCSGLSYGLLDPGTTIFKAYNERVVMNPARPLAGMMDALADLPLVFHPGTGWEYSVATDVVARLVEILSGQSFGAFVKARILDPLGMTDTGFFAPADQQHRLAVLYTGADLLDPMKPGLTRADHLPYPGAYRAAVPMQSGGGGLVSSLPDMVALMRALLPGGPTLLKPETIALMMTNQLPEGMNIRFPGFGEIVGKGYGLAGAVTLQPSAIEPATATGEFQWGGIGGTHWWISPANNLAGLLMTQRWMGFWHPFSFEFKQQVYRAIGR